MKIQFVICIFILCFVYSTFAVDTVCDSACFNVSSTNITGGISPGSAMFTLSIFNDGSCPIQGMGISIPICANIVAISSTCGVNYTTNSTGFSCHAMLFNEYFFSFGSNCANFTIITILMNTEMEFDEGPVILYDFSSDQCAFCEGVLYALPFACAVPPATTGPITSQVLTTSPITTSPFTSQQQTTIPVTTNQITTAPLTIIEATTIGVTTIGLTTQPLTTQGETTVAITTTPLTTHVLTTAAITTFPITTTPFITAKTTGSPVEPISAVMVLGFTYAFTILIIGAILLVLVMTYYCWRRVFFGIEEEIGEVGYSLSSSSDEEMPPEEQQQQLQTKSRRSRKLISNQ